MHVINARNVNDALPEALRFLFANGRRRESRNGPVLVAPTPVATCYRSPTERVLFSALRDANPFFHLFEALWMLAGRRDVAYVRQFAGNIALYSDDGETFHGAYGHRWRRAFAADQLPPIISRLRANRDDRRQVLQMWDAEQDLLADQSRGLDFPCNLAASFHVNDEGMLDMTVFNRSNDIVWGCYGANVVHFSVLHELVAHGAGVPVGRYWQVSTNWHGYLKTLEPLRELADLAPEPFSPFTRGFDLYSMGQVAPVPLLSEGEEVMAFLAEVEDFVAGTHGVGYRSRFLRRVAFPVLEAWMIYKSDAADRHDQAIVHLADNCAALDWRIACQQWVARRKERGAQVPRMPE
jgi:hypothetical protein